MKVKFILFVMLIFSATNIFSQENMPVGARQDAMGGSGLIGSDVWSNYHNQAGLAEIDGISAGIYFSNQFNNKDMGLSSFAFGMPIMKNGAVGASFTHFGYSLYNQNKFGISYAMKLGRRFSAGIQMDYFMMQQGLEYGNTSAIAGEIGIISEPIDNFFVAAHIFNPTFSSYKSGIYQLPTILKLGVGYNFSEKVFFTIEGEKDMLYEKAVFRSGLEYNVIKGLYLRAGFSTNPTQYAFGVGYNFKGVQLDFSMKSHEVLGFYPQFGLSYTFKKK